MAGTSDDPLDLDEASNAGAQVDAADSLASSDPVISAAGATGADGAAAADAGDGEADGEGDEPVADLLEREGEAAADYLEGLLDIIDADGDIDMDVEGDRAVVSIIGDRLRHLVGPGGSVLDAIQELTRLAVARETGVRSRLMLDIGGHRARRREELTKIGTQAAEQAASSGQAVTLNPMTAFERKVVHDAVAAAGQRSESEGVEPQRRVIVLPGRRPAAVSSADSAETADQA